MIATKTLAQPQPLRPFEIEELRDSLHREREALKARYQEDIRSAREIQEEGGEDLAELASMEVDRELLFSMCQLDLEKAEQIEEALQRIEEGTYGLCQSAGEPIPLERLREIPWARYCARHQTLSEETEASSGQDLPLSGYETGVQEDNP